jgi:hypothetical protein
MPHVPARVITSVCMNLTFCARYHTGQFQGLMTQSSGRAMIPVWPLFDTNLPANLRGRHDTRSTSVIAPGFQIQEHARPNASRVKRALGHEFAFVWRCMRS